MLQTGQREGEERTAIGKGGMSLRNAPVNPNRTDPDTLDEVEPVVNLHMQTHDELQVQDRESKEREMRVLMSEELI